MQTIKKSVTDGRTSPKLYPFASRGIMIVRFNIKKMHGISIPNRRFSIVQEEFRAQKIL